MLFCNDLSQDYLDRRVTYIHLQHTQRSTHLEPTFFWTYSNASFSGVPILLRPRNLHSNGGSCRLFGLDAEQINIRHW